MSHFKDIYKQFEEASTDEKLVAARGAAGEVMAFLNDKTKDSDFKTGFFLILLGTLIGVDGTVTQAEVDVFNAVFDTDYTSKDLVRLISNLSTKENMELIDRVIDSMPEKIKLSTCVLALTVLSADGKIDDEEAKFFEKIVA